MAFSFPFLSRYRSAIIGITAIAAGCSIYYIQTAASSSLSSSASVTSTSQNTRLHRSNAQRGRRHRRSQISSETDRVEEDETDRQWEDAGDLDVQNTTVTSTRVSPSSAPPAEEDLITELEITGDDSSGEECPTEHKNRLHLLYRIAEEQSIKEGYIHRGISCNSCSQLPIRGIRFRCANCFDYDLCEQCEANDQHGRRHVFIKIKIPIPVLGSRRQNPLPVFYPGQPTDHRDHQEHREHRAHQNSHRLPFSTVKHYAQENHLVPSEVEALWDQFNCLASPPLLQSPLLDGDDLVISRKTFMQCFIPPGTIRTVAINLIYDRMFDFYDIDRDEMITFDEFLNGIACLTKKSKAEERLRRAFDGYDIRQNGSLNRDDFFRAYYALNQELTKEMMVNQSNEVWLDEDIIESSQPISSAFNGRLTLNQQSRAGEGKSQEAETGDYVIKDGGNVLSEPTNEPDMPEDFGREVIYKATLDAFEELLVPLFRGRGGRISFDEFKETLTGPEGEKMGFLTSWLDMAIF